MSSLGDMRARLQREETFEELMREPPPPDHHADADPKTLLMTKIDCPNCPDFKAVCMGVETVTTNNGKHTKLTWQCNNHGACTFTTTTFFSAEALAKGKAAAISEATIKSMKGVGTTAEEAASSIRKFGKAIGQALPSIPKLPVFPPPSLPAIPTPKFSIPSLPMLPFNTPETRVTVSVVSVLIIVVGVLCAGLVFGGILTWVR